MHSIDLTKVIAQRPFFKEKPRRLGLWATLVVSNASWCGVCVFLLASAFSITKLGKVATDRFVEQRAHLQEIETAKAEAIAERDTKIANLLKFQSSSTT